MTALHYLPNALSIARIALGLMFPLVPAEWRLGVVIAAALSDLFDGFAARVLHAESNAGRLLDPIADKVFVLVLAGTLIAEGALHPLWAVGLAVRDITVLIGLGYVLAKRQWARGRRLRPSFVGKVTTAAQFALLLALVVWSAVPGFVLAVVTMLSAVAAWDYARKFLVSDVVQVGIIGSGELSHPMSEPIDRGGTTVVRPEEKAFESRRGEPPTGCPPGDG